jgi:hypothetical protein
VTPAIEKQLSLPLPSYITSLPFVSRRPGRRRCLRTMLRCRSFASGFFWSRTPWIAATPAR